jgi:VWFA-related protein
VVFRTDVALARVDAQVVDRSNRAITGLARTDFVLRQGGQSREIRNFASEDMPVDVILLLDVSGSMRPHVQKIADASEDALRALGPEDRVAIMVFDRSTRTRARFSRSLEGVESELRRLVRDEGFDGGTDINRGIEDAIRFMQKEGRRDARRAIVILTDDQTERTRDVDGISIQLARADTVLSALIAPDMMSYQRGGGGGGPWGGNRGGVIFGPGGPWGGNYPGGGYPGGGGGYPGGGRSRTQAAGTAEIARQSGGDSMRVDDAYAFQTTLERIRQRYALFYLVGEGNAQSGGLTVDLADSVRRRHPDAQVRYRRIHQDGAGATDPVLVTQAPEWKQRPSSEDRTARDGESSRPGGGWRRVDEQRRGSGPGTILNPVDPAPAAAPAPAAESSTTGGGWRKADEAAKTAETAKAPAAEQESKGGWRKLKPGEKP